MPGQPALTRPVRLTARYRTPDSQVGVNGGRTRAHGVVIRSDTGPGFGPAVIGPGPVAHGAAGSENAPAIDHIPVPSHRLDEGVLIETSGPGTGSGAVGMDQQGLGTTHLIEIPDAEGR